MNNIKVLILENGHKFYVVFDSEKKMCRYCRKMIQWGYQENGRAASIEEHEGKFRLHFPLCTPMHQKRYSSEYVQLTDGVNTNEAKLTNIRRERRRYVR